MMNKKTELMKAVNSLIEVCKDKEFEPALIPRRLESLQAMSDMNYGDLLQALRHNSQIVYAYTAESAIGSACYYNGLELFPCKATRIYSYCVLEDEDVVLMNRILELWLLEDFSFAMVANTEVDYEDGEYCTAYRVIRTTDLEEIAEEMNLNMDRVIDNLTEFAKSHEEAGMPIYEL